MSLPESPSLTEESPRVSGVSTITGGGDPAGPYRVSLDDTFMSVTLDILLEMSLLLLYSKTERKFTEATLEMVMIDNLHPIPGSINRDSTNLYKIPKTF